MDIGFFSYNTEYGIRADELAKELETRGFESLWVGEHTHIPASRETPFPGGGELPKPYYHMSDPFVTLAMAAAVTNNLKLGTGISLVVEHDPIVLAKSVATLDHYSNGRFLFGIGGGWNKEEMENHGYPFERRWKLLRERIEAMKTIWTEEEANYSGEFVEFERIISNPKPAQKPHPPVLMGGATDMSLKRVARYCDGWMPIDVLLREPQTMVEKLRRALEEEGRNHEDIQLSAFCQRARDAGSLKKFREAGFTRAIIGLPNRSRDEVLTFVDEYVGLGEEIG
ncbi:MAG: F420-dependent hydroxymycolic acid dehydrogenase [Alphaproteobacteria bacterium MarineAlpha4_Bin2]|nr:MAG: F420-dependent hydroxymycolic acid dehydrogenase [Alphaproteobacteria bacterium MarineAlpha4_Bin2]